MLRFVVRRLLLLTPILLGVSILLFFWVRALPGSPAESPPELLSSPPVSRTTISAIAAAPRMTPTKMRRDLLPLWSANARAG